MAKKFLVSIDLNKNEIQNFVVHTLGTPPITPVDGQAYFNSTDNALYMRISGVWVDITGKVRSITSTTTALAIDITTDPLNPALSIADANGTNSGLLSSTFFTDLTDATNLATANTLVKRDANGDIVVNAITAVSGTISGTPTNATDIATKGYVDGLVTSAMTFKGVVDASTNPDYPAAVLGDMWQISVDGLIGGVSGTVVEAGDMFVCIAASSVGGDQATVGAEFSILQNNLGQATTVVPGIARIATPAEILDGTSETTFVTPKALADELAGLGAGTTTAFTGLIGDAAATSFIVTHNLGNQFCSLQVFDAVTNDEVIADINLTSATTSTITFNAAPALNAYRVVAIG